MNISDRVDVSSDLRDLAEKEVAVVYRRAARLASQETGLPLSTFSDSCHYTVEQLRDRDYLPE